MWVLYSGNIFNLTVCKGYLENDKRIDLGGGKNAILWRRVVGRRGTRAWGRTWGRGGVVGRRGMVDSN